MEVVTSHFDQYPDYYAKMVITVNFFVLFLVLQSPIEFKFTISFHHFIFIYNNLNINITSNMHPPIPISSYQLSPRICLHFIELNTIINLIYTIHVQFYIHMLHVRVHISYPHVHVHIQYIISSTWINLCTKSIQVNNIYNVIFIKVHS